MDDRTKSSLDDYFATWFGLPVAALREPVVRVVPALPGDGGVAMFRLGLSCVVVVVDSQVETSAAVLSGLGPEEVFAPEVAARLAGQGAVVPGPSWHGYVTAAGFRGQPSSKVERLDLSDPRLRSRRDSSDLADWGEGGFPLDPAADPSTSALYGVIDGDEVVAAGNMTEWRKVPADVGLFTHPHRRGEGLASMVAATMTSEWLPKAGIVRYRALLTNGPSLAIASRLGFEGYGLNIFARQP